MTGSRWILGCIGPPTRLRPVRARRPRVRSPHSGRRGSQHPPWPWRARQLVLGLALRNRIRGGAPCWNGTADEFASSAWWVVASWATADHQVRVDAIARSRVSSAWPACSAMCLATTISTSSPVVTPRSGCRLDASRSASVSLSSAVVMRAARSRHWSAITSAEPAVAANSASRSRSTSMPQRTLSSRCSVVPRAWTASA